jgi:hypothetical protein
MSEIEEVMARGMEGWAFGTLEREPDPYRDDRAAREIAIDRIQEAKLKSRDILAALDAAGYAVVRKEPTEKMLEAALAALSDVTIEEPKAAAWGALRAYRAMLAAFQLKGEGFNEPEPHTPQYPRALCSLPECACTAAYLCDRAREAMAKR